jgi:hypothetical protein
MVQIYIFRSSTKNRALCTLVKFIFSAHPFAAINIAQLLHSAFIMLPSAMASNTPTFLRFPRLPDELKVQIIAYAWEAEFNNRDTKPTITLKFVPVAIWFDVQLSRSTFPHLLHVNRLFRTEILKFVRDKFILPFSSTARVSNNHWVSFNTDSHVLELDLQDIETAYKTLRYGLYKLSTSLRDNVQHVRLLVHPEYFDRSSHPGVTHLIVYHFVKLIQVPMVETRLAPMDTPRTSTGC